MATGAHGNPGASAAGLVVEAHRARLGPATILHLDQEADSAAGRQPRPRGATPKHVQLLLPHVADNHCNSCYTEGKDAPQAAVEDFQQGSVQELSSQEEGRSTFVSLKVVEHGCSVVLN